MPFLTSVMKIIDATSEIPGMTTEEEVDRFLQSKSNLQLATIDEKGEPNIQAIWFYYDTDQKKLLFNTSKLAKKTQNLKRNPTIYFSIDCENYEENHPPKGVKGKGTATIVEDPNKFVPQTDKISMKYLGTFDHPIAKCYQMMQRREKLYLLKLIPSSSRHGVTVKCFHGIRV